MNIKRQDAHNLRTRRKPLSRSGGPSAPLKNTSNLPPAHGLNLGILRYDGHRGDITVDIAGRYHEHFGRIHAGHLVSGISIVPVQLSPVRNGRRDINSSTFQRVLVSNVSEAHRIPKGHKRFCRGKSNVSHHSCRDQSHVPLMISFTRVLFLLSLPVFSILPHSSRRMVWTIPRREDMCM